MSSFRPYHFLAAALLGVAFVAALIVFMWAPFLLGGIIFVLAVVAGISYTRSKEEDRWRDALAETRLFALILVAAVFGLYALSYVLNFGAEFMQERGIPAYERYVENKRLSRCEKIVRGIAIDRNCERRQDCVMTRDEMVRKDERVQYYIEHCSDMIDDAVFIEGR